MRSGECNNLFTIQIRSETQSATTGEVTFVWVDDGFVWGSLKSNGASNRDGDAYDANLASFTIECRYKANIGKDTRLKLRSRYFHVVSFVADDRFKEMTIQATEATGT